MTDNSDLKTKIAVRQKGIQLLRRSVSVLELYAGEGHISQFWAKIANPLLAVEKELEKCRKNPVNPQNGRAENYLSYVPQFSVIDLDAYGLVSPVLNEVRKLVKDDTLVFFTEFNPIHYKYGWKHKFIDECISLEPTAVYYTQSQNSPVIYGFCYF